MRYLHYCLKRDIKRVGLPVDFELDLRGYSKIYDGRYDPNTNKIILYPLTKDGRVREYETVLKIAIHEAIHHYQWNYDPTFNRVKGIMHNPAFHDIYIECMFRAKRLNLIGGSSIATQINKVVDFVY